MQINSALNITYEIAVYDVVGQLVYSSNNSLNAGFNTIILPLNNFTNGVYQLHIKTANEEWHTSLVKD